MKTKSAFRLVRTGTPAAYLLAAATAALLAVSAAQAANLYWDTNGATIVPPFGNGTAVSGSGASTGTWGTDGWWSLFASGSFGDAGRINTTALDNLIINASGNTGGGIPNTLINVNGNQYASSIYDAASNSSNDQATLTGGTIHLYSTVSGATTSAICGTGDYLLTINSALALEQASGSNVYIGGTESGGNGAVNITGGITSTNSALNLVLQTNHGLTISGSSLNFQGSLTSTKTNTFTISANIGSNVTNVTQNGAGGTMILSGSNSYTGGAFATNGILRYDALSAIAGTGRNITVTGPGAVALGYTPSGSIQTDLLGRIVTSSTGAFALTSSSSENFDFSSAGNNFTALSLGAIGTQTYTGTLTANGSTYRLGGGGGTLVFTPTAIDSSKNLVINGNGLTGTVDFGAQSQTFGAITIGSGTVQNGSLTGTSYTVNDAAATTISASLNGAAGLTKTGVGTLTLSGANTYTGTTTINAGTLTLNRQLGSLDGTSPYSALTFSGTGSFNLDNTGATAALSQNLGALTFSAGEGTVKSTRTAAQDELLTFSSLATRAAGAVGNFSPNAGTNGATNGFVLTGQAAGFIDPGIFYGNTSYAYMNAAGTYVRGITYGTDTNTQTYAATTSITPGTNTEIQTTGAISAQTSATFRTLRSGGNMTLATGATLTVTGILTSATTTISGGTGIQAASGAELVIRNDNALTISNPILANGSNALTKSGTGILALGGASTYTGKTTVLTGTLNYSVPLTNVGVAGPLGAPTTAANGTIDLYPGTTFANTYATQTNQTTDRNINLAGSGSGTVTLNGTNVNDTSFTFGAITGTGTGPRALTIKVQGDRPIYNYNGISDMSDGSSVSVFGVWGSGSSRDNGVIHLTGVSTFTGAITLTGSSHANNPGESPGTFLVGGSNIAFSNNAISFTSGGTATLGSGSYAGNINFVAGSANVPQFYYASGANQTLSGLISGPGNLGMSGSSGTTLTLSGANTFTGQTTITGGKVVMGNALALQNSAYNTTGSTGAIGLDVTGYTTPTLGGLSGSVNLATAITGYGAVSALNLNPQAGVNVTYSGAIADGTAGMVLNMNGVGTQVLSGTNLYTGGTHVNFGTLTYLASTAKPGTGTTTVASGATLGLGVVGTSCFTSANVDALFAGTLANVTNSATSNVGIDTTNGNFTYASSVPSTTRGLVKLGANTLTLTGNDILGPVTVSAGTLIATGNNTLGGGMTVNSGTTATLSGNNTVTGGITDLGTLNINSAGALGSATLVLGSGSAIANTSGTVVVNSNVNPVIMNGGTITFSGSTLNLGTGAVALTAAQTLAVSTEGPLTIGGAISGAFGLTKSGVGMLQLTGANTYTGTTTVSAGTLAVSGSGTLGATTAPLTMSGGMLDLGGTSQTVGTVTISGAGVGDTIRNGNLTGLSNTAYAVSNGGGYAYIPANLLASGTAGFTKSGAGWVNLTGANTYSGVTTFTAGTVSVAAIGNGGLASAPLGTASNAATNLVFGGGTLQYSGASATTDRAFTLNAGSSGTIEVLNGATNLSMPGATGGVTTGALTKLGSGTLTLTGINTNTGTTTVAGGTLTLNRATGSLSSTALTFNAGGGTFNMDNTGAVGALTQTLGALTFSAGNGTVMTTRSVAADQKITFASLAARTAGATGNFVNTGTNSATNGFVFTSAPTAGALIDRGLFYNGSSYAAYDAGGFIRAYTTTDTSYLAAPTGTTIGASVATSNVDLTTGNITGQTTVSANTINLRNSSLTMSASGQILSANGILSSGSSSATLGISTKDSILQATATGNELVMRVDGSSDSLTLNSIIQNNGASASKVTKTGAGTLTLTGTNAFTGGFYLDGGTLNINSAGALGASTGEANASPGAQGSLFIGNGATISNTTGAALDLTANKINMIWNGSFTVDGTADGLKDLKFGNLSQSNVNGVALTGNTTVNVTGGTFTAGTHLYGAFSLTKNGPGELDLGNNNNNISGFTGNLIINEGTFGGNGNTGAQSVFGTQTVQLGDNTSGSTKNAALEFKVPGNNGTPAYASNSINVRAGSSGTLALINNDTSSTSTHGIAGTVMLNNNLTLASIGLNNGNPNTLELQGLVLGTGNLRIGDPTYTNVGTVLLSAANAYTGSTTIQSGTLSISSIKNVGGVANSMGQPLLANATIGMGSTTSGGTLLYTGTGDTSDRVIDLAGTTGGATLDQSGTGLLKFTSAMTASGVGAKTLTLQGSTAGTGEIDGAIVDSSSGATSLTKAGTDTWTLAGTNTYTGATNVNGGTLLINGANTGNGVLNVASVATLGGTGSIAGAVNVTGVLSPGAGVGTLGFGGGLTLGAGSIFNWENNTSNTLGTAGTHWDVANVTSGSTTLSNIASTGSKLKLLFTNAATDFTNAFWNGSKAWNIITGGLSAGNLFDISNISIYINSVLQNAGSNVVTGRGAFSTAVVGNNLELLWTSNATPYQQWAQTNITAIQSGADATAGGDPDADGIKNVNEFAFDTAPLAASSGTGAIAYSGSAVTAHGQPIVVAGSPNKAVFGRRLTAGNDGLTYTVEFSADLVNWATSSATPNQIATDATLEAVSVDYPPTITTSGGGTQVPRFFRVLVSLAQ